MISKEKILLYETVLGKSEMTQESSHHTPVVLYRNVDGEFHRLDGPAIQCIAWNKYFINGKEYKSLKEMQNDITFLYKQSLLKSIKTNHT